MEAQPSRGERMVRGKTWSVERSDLASALQTCGKPRLTIIKKPIILYAKFKVHRVEQETTKLTIKLNDQSWLLIVLFVGRSQVLRTRTVRP